MNKVLLLLYVFWGMVLSLDAQEHFSNENSIDSLDVDVDRRLDSVNVPLMLPSASPEFILSAPGFDGCSPWFMGSYGPSWELHEGFNAQLGLSLASGWGKNAPSGVGFGQTFNVAYAKSLNQRFSAAVGLYMNNMDWGNFHQRDVGLSAVLGFKVNNVLNLYAYGTKSFLPKQNFGPMNMYPFYPSQFRDRLGAMAEIKIGENAKIQISVERNSGPNWEYFPQSTPPDQNRHLDITNQRR